ncbi:MAG: nucleotidyltransferase domain-containing protein [Blastocatellia bacterium]|nr:nucleotidyltransferase domain-containing protein [Blastocatellia bacterium]
MNERLSHIVNDVRQSFESLYGERLQDVILFGSQARGDAQTGSDIDLLVVLDGDVRPGEEILRTGDIVSSISLKYDVVVSCLFLPAGRFAHEQGPLLRNVRREGVSV